jgi:hypothetical protein
MLCEYLKFDCALKLAHASHMPCRYGYQTSTRIKIVLTLALTEETVKDNDIKTVC